MYAYSLEVDTRNYKNPKVLLSLYETINYKGPKTLLSLYKTTNYNDLKAMLSLYETITSIRTEGAVMTLTGPIDQCAADFYP